MIILADTNIILDCLDGSIPDPHALILPFQIIRISPVVLHEVLRSYSESFQDPLKREFSKALTPPPRLEHWTESAQILRILYSKRKEKNIARMQNDILIALSARDLGAPIWSRDSDFEQICNHLGIRWMNH